MSRRSPRSFPITEQTNLGKKRKQYSSQGDEVNTPSKKLAKKDFENKYEKKDLFDLSIHERAFVQKKYDFLVGKVIGFNSDNKEQAFEPSLNRLAWVSEETEGQGDCLFHAVFGNWNEIRRKIFCDEVDTLRKRVQGRILEELDKKEDEVLRKMIIEGIRALIMEEKDKNSPLPNMPHTALLLQEYCDWVKQDQEASSIRWRAFEIELKKYPQILEFIENHHLSRKKGDKLALREKFQNALNTRTQEDVLRTMIRREPLLELAYAGYNKGEEFNWKLKLSNAKELITEYAQFVGRRGQSLSPSELEMVAWIFKLNVNFRSDTAANLISHRYGGTKDFVLVKFTGQGYYGHYERCENILLTEEDQQLDVLGQVTALELEASFLKRSIAGITILLMKLASSFLKQYKASKTSQLRLDQTTNDVNELKGALSRLLLNNEFTNEFNTSADLLPQKNQILQTCLAEAKEHKEKIRKIITLQEKYKRLLILLPTLEMKLARNRRKIGQLIDSIVSEDLSAVTEEKLLLLADSPKPGYEDIYEAIEWGDIKSFRILIKGIIKEYGLVSKCIETNRGTNLLEEAIFYGTYNPEIVNLLLEHKDVTFPSELMEAAYRGHVETLVRIQQTATIQAVDRHGCTALHYAAAANQREAVIWLDQAGLDVRAKEGVLGSTPWLLAAGSGHLPILKYFFEEKKQEPAAQRMLLEEKDNSNNTAFLLAARNGYSSIVEWFLQLKINIDETDIELYTATHLAIYYNHLSTLEKLLEYKPDLTKEENHGNTPLMLAAFRGNLAMVKLLLELDKSSINKQNNTGCNILHLTLTYFNQIPEIIKLAIVRLLIKNGASLKTRDGDGYTPLLIAIHNGYYNVVKFMLGVDKDKVTLKDKYGDNYKSIMDLLMNTLKRVDIAVLLLKTDPILKEKYDSEVQLFPYANAHFHRQVQSQLKSTQKDNLIDDETLSFLEQITLKAVSSNHLIVSSSQEKNLRDLQKYEQDLRTLNKLQADFEHHKKRLDILVNYPTIIAETKQNIAQALEREDFQLAKNLSETAAVLQMEYKSYQNIQEELHKVEGKLIQIKEQRQNIADNRSALLVTIKSGYKEPIQEQFVAEEMKLNFHT